LSRSAGRHTIEASDVEALFRKQQLVDDEHSLEDLIREHLPQELIDELIPVARAFNLVMQ
jgi:hypothetical protein